MVSGNVGIPLTTLNIPVGLLSSIQLTVLSRSAIFLKSKVLERFCAFILLFAIVCGNIMLKEELYIKVLFKIFCWRFCVVTLLFGVLWV